MMHTVGSYEAKTHLPELLDRVAKGDTVTITKRGVPVARLVPPALPEHPDVTEVISDLLAYSQDKNRTLGGVALRELVREGRRF